jgi:hypothetical protein
MTGKQRSRRPKERESGKIDSHEASAQGAEIEEARR